MINEEKRPTKKKKGIGVGWFYLAVFFAVLSIGLLGILIWQKRSATQEGDLSVQLAQAQAEVENLQKENAVYVAQLAELAATPEVAEETAETSAGEESSEGNENTEETTGEENSEENTEENHEAEGSSEEENTEEESSEEEFGVNFETHGAVNKDPLYKEFAKVDGRYDHLQYKYESMYSYPTDILFLGDSLIERGAWEEFYPGKSVKNRGIGGDEVEGVMARMESIAATKPKEIYLMVGVNDLMAGRLGSGRFEHTYGQLLDMLKSETGAEITAMGILPVADSMEEQIGGELNDWIRQANEIISRECSERDIRYVNISDGLYDGSRLNNDYSYDGIHLNGEGYRIWKENLDPYINHEE